MPPEIVPPTPEFVPMRNRRVGRSPAPAPPVNRSGRRSNAPSPSAAYMPRNEPRSNSPRSNSPRPFIPPVARAKPSVAPPPSMNVNRNVSRRTPAPSRRTPAPSRPSAAASRGSVSPASPRPESHGQLPPAGTYLFVAPPSVRASPKPAAGPPRHSAVTEAPAADTTVPFVEEDANSSTVVVETVVPEVIAAAEEVARNTPRNTPVPNVVNRMTRRVLTNRNAARMLANRATRNERNRNGAKIPIMEMPRSRVLALRAPPQTTFRPPSPTMYRDDE